MAEWYPRVASSIGIYMCRHEYLWGDSGLWPRSFLNLCKFLKIICINRLTYCCDYCQNGNWPPNTTVESRSTTSRSKSSVQTNSCRTRLKLGDTHSLAHSSLLARMLSLKWAKGNCIAVKVLWRIFLWTPSIMRSFWAIIVLFIGNI